MSSPCILDELDEIANLHKHLVLPLSERLLSDLYEWAQQPRKDQRNMDAAIWMARQIEIYAREQGITIEKREPA